MAKLSTIKQVLEASNKMPIEAVKGKLTTLWKQTTGEGQYGQWTLQNGELQDSTGKVKVVFSNCDELPEMMKGKVITILANNGAKGWTGSVAQDKENKRSKKVERELHVTKTAQIAEIGSVSDAPQPDNDSDASASSQQSAPAPSNKPATQAVSSKKDDIDKIIEMKRFLARHGNAMFMSACESMRTIQNFAESQGLRWNEEMKNGFAQMICEKMTDTSFTTLFIRAKDCGLTNEFPSNGNINEKVNEARERLKK